MKSPGFLVVLTRARAPWRGAHSNEIQNSSSSPQAGKGPFIFRGQAQLRSAHDLCQDQSTDALLNSVQGPGTPHTHPGRDYEVTWPLPLIWSTPTSEPSVAPRATAVDSPHTPDRQANTATWESGYSIPGRMRPSLPSRCRPAPPRWLPLFFRTPFPHMLTACLCRLPSSQRKHGQTPRPFCSLLFLATSMAHDKHAVNTQ